MTKSTEDLLVHISKEHLVKELGGSSTWSWEYPKIVPGENKAQVDNAGRERAQAERDALVADYMKITREWMHSDDPLVAKKRQLAALKMRAQYFTLDPYIRGRGAYHRSVLPHSWARADLLAATETSLETASCSSSTPASHLRASGRFRATRRAASSRSSRPRSSPRRSGTSKCDSLLDSV